MPSRFAHAGDFHLDEDHYFADTAHCLEWFGADAIRAGVTDQGNATVNLGIAIYVSAI